MLTEVEEALYGGAAGGGKSEALLMAALQFVEVPGYSALLLRRTFPDLNQPDALIPRSLHWLTGKAHWNGQSRRWTFPSGATLTFGYLQHGGDELQYQGAAFQYVGFDELTQHPEDRYLYLFSRLRRLEGVEVPLRMRGATNPGGPGHAWVKQRFLTNPVDEYGRRRFFVSAKLEDNQHLDAVSYRQSLARLDPVTRAQLLSGDWDAYAGGRFQREWFPRYQFLGDAIRLRKPGDAEWTARVHRLDECLVFQTVDPAASESTDADFTVISTWALTPNSELVWLDCERFQAQIPDIPPRIEEAYRQWQAAFVGIEAVASNAGVLQLCQRRPIVAKSLSPRGLDKLVRATPAIVLAESGRIWVPEHAPWLDTGFNEVLHFTGVAKADAHDDVVDTLSYAVWCMEEYGGHEVTEGPYIVYQPQR